MAIPLDAEWGKYQSNGLEPYPSVTLAEPEAGTLVVENDDYDMFAFLSEERCNPPLDDPMVRKRGNLRADYSPRRELSGRAGRSRLQCMQSLVGLIVLSWPVQTLVFTVVVFDMVLTGVSLSGAVDRDAEAAQSLFFAADVTIVTILAIDVCGRWFAQGSTFFIPIRNCKMNIFEATLVPITILEVSVLQDLDLPTPILRALRPLLRLVRIVRVLVRTAGKGKQYLRRLRHQVSGDRMRFIQDDYDLDIQYITPQILVMSDPAVGREAILRNPLKEVSSFLNERHGNKYLVLNATEARRYPLTPIFRRYYHFPIKQDSVPTLDGLKTLVKALDAWLKADDHNVLAVHSKHNQGRVAIVVIALMLFRKDYRSATSALAAFEHHRKRKESHDVENIQTLDSASQVRFLEYFAHMCTLPKGLPWRPARISRIQLSGLPSVSSLDVSCLPHPGALVRMSGSSAVQDNWNTGKSQTLSRSKTDMSAYDDDLDGFVMEEPSSLLRAVRNAIEEGSMDSRLSGALPTTGRPLFSSSAPEEERAGQKKIKSTVHEEKDTGITLAKIWDVRGVELAGEFVLEFHLKGDSGGDQLLVGDADTRWQRLLACCCRRRRRASFVDSGGRKFSDGMLFGCWLHSALLEHNEVQDKRPTRGKKGLRLELSLDRFALDKAANAPSLRNLSSAMKLDIDFVVDERVTLQDLDNDPPELHLVPSSVNMSDWETLNWLTWVSEKVWPNFKSGFTKMISDGIEGARQGLPGPLRNLRLVQCSFGDAFPRFGPICASSAKDEEVQLDIGLSYSTETSIVLEVGYLAFGINHLKIGGMLSLKFTPLLDEVPVFSAMQLFFLNSPEIDLRFTNVLEVANTSFLMDKIRSVINQALNSKLVVPNVLNINWADPSNDDSVTWTSIMPVFVIRVAVHRARELRSSSSVLVRQPDAHVRLQVGSQLMRTKTVPGRDPVWASSFDCVVYDARQHVDIKVFDTDFTGRSYVIGKINKVPVAQVVDKGQWMQLHGTPGRANSEVFVTATVFNLKEDPSKLPAQVLASSAEMEFNTLASQPTHFITVAGTELEEEEDDEGEDGSDEGEAESDTAEEDHGRAAGETANSVALLVCTLHGGQMPEEVGKPSEVDVRVNFGEATSLQRCQAPDEGSEGTLSRKTFKAVEFLATRGSTAEEVAELLDENVEDVRKAIRRITCNFRAQQKICLMLQPNDFKDSRSIHFFVQTASKKKVLATGKLEIAKLLANGKYDGQVDCVAGGGGRRIVKLHVDLRLFALERNDRQRDGTQMQMPDGSPDAELRSPSHALRHQSTSKPRGLKRANSKVVAKEGPSLATGE